MRRILSLIVMLSLAGCASACHDPHFSPDGKTLTVDTLAVKNFMNVHGGTGMAAPVVPEQAAPAK